MSDESCIRLSHLEPMVLSDGRDSARELDKVRAMVHRGKLEGSEAIQERVLGILKSYRIRKHYHVDIRDDSFDYVVDDQALRAETAAEAQGAPSLCAKLNARHAKHIAAIAKKLEKLHQRIQKGQLHGEGDIGVRVGKVINKYKVAKHFDLHIKDDAFHFAINQEKVSAEAALDGIYVGRTSLPTERDEQARAAADASIDLDAEVWNCPACTAAFPRAAPAARSAACASAETR